jgi:pyruvate ferredoxin oxidoreductase beta subunit
LKIDFPQLKPLTEYTRLQGRFKHLTPEMLDKIQTKVTEKYNEIKEMSYRNEVPA